MKPHTAQHTGQNGLAYRQMEGLPAAARMRSKTLCRQELASLSKNSLQEQEQGHVFQHREVQLDSGKPKPHVASAEDLS